MSSADQILSAKISAVCRRHCARGRIEDQDQAVAELRAFDRSDLLSQHAGLAQGRAEKDLPMLAPGYRAEAALCTAAGALPVDIEPWVEVGRKRAQNARVAPWTGD